MPDVAPDNEMGEVLFVITCKLAGGNLAARNLGLLTAALHGRRVMTEMIALHLVLGDYFVRSLIPDSEATPILAHYWAALPRRAVADPMWAGIDRDMTRRLDYYFDQVRLRSNHDDAITRLATLALTRGGVEVDTHRKTLVYAFADAMELRARVEQALRYGNRILG